ncbi:MAG TPA: hypothetical protein VFX59_03465, partial [Polyangiales bacterium]|nr:hypothetical protein [Polyangiales bacterium]
MQSDVVITGYRLNAKEPAQKALERILGLPPEVARALARNFPAVVVEGAANDNALRIRDQLESAGALVEVRASRGRNDALELAPARGGAFDLDLDLPMGGGAAPAKANKSGTGAFAALPRTGPGGFPAPARSGTGAFASPKTGSHLAVPMPPPTRAGNPRQAQPTSRGLRGSLPQPPPPPPPSAYQLGDFGVAPRGLSVVAKLPTGPASVPPASPPTLADGDFDFDSAAAGGGIELELGTGPHRSVPRKPSQAAK